MIKIRQEEQVIRAQWITLCLLYFEMSRDSEEYEIVANALAMIDFKDLKEVSAEAQKSRQQGNKLTESGRTAAIDYAYTLLYLEMCFRAPM